MPDLVVAFGLVAVVMTVTALASGLVERSPLSLPMIFLALGFALGEGGFGVVALDSRDPLLEIIAVLTLSLVLFLDAVKLQIDELGRRWLVPALILGPGTGIIIALGALPLALAWDLPWLIAFIGGAILASTDPIILREILRDPHIPRSVRQVLKLEAGISDLVVLPVILVLIAVAAGEVSSTGGWLSSMSRLLLVGPAIGFVIGGMGSWAMSRVDARFGIRQEHQALYGIGLVLAAYSAADAVGGDGFLAAFAAGMGVIVLNQRLCECFLEYGETTSEMAMLLAFLMFGAVLSGLLDEVRAGPAVLLAGLVIFAIRPGVLAIVLSRARLSREARMFLAWFGPRGLDSLLLTLLVVQAGLPGSEVLLAAVGSVVTASVLIHGASATPVAAAYRRKAQRETLTEEREATAAGLFQHRGADVRRVDPEELNLLLGGSEAPVVLDVRSRSSYVADGARIPGDIRVMPDQVLEWGLSHPQTGLIVLYCT